MENNIPFHTLLAFLFVCFGMTSSTNISTLDRSALLAFKSRLLSYNKNEVMESNWSSSIDVCEWVGVTCGIRHRRVTALNLTKMALGGTIPPQVGNLSFLVSIDISHNNFIDPLPQELAFLPRLRSLRLEYNNFGGEVPSWLGVAAKLESLYLSSNRFTGPIPSSIFNITSLNVLDLTSNNLSGNLPAEMCREGDLDSGLNYLSLAQNQLHGQMPSALFACRKLKELYLSENDFTASIPREIANLSMLTALDLQLNQLQGAIPNEMASLTDIIYINLAGNNLTGDIPPNVFNNSKLIFFNVVYNHLTGQLPQDFGLRLPNLKQIFLGANDLSGKIPDSVSNSSNLQDLDMSFNRFTGYIPKDLGNLKFLKTFTLGWNLLTAESSSGEGLLFISSLANCKELKILSVPSNPLNGTLPSSLGNFSALEQIYLYKSGIKGTIPNEVGNLSKLISLNLRNNELEGYVPATIGGLENLQSLNLTGNRLRGAIPSSLCHLKNLFMLSLRRNELSGQVPGCIGNATSLTTVHLDSNKLTSKIPSTFWSLTDIQSFNLSTNFLDGYLSSEIGSLKAARIIDLSGNHFQGAIPVTMGSLRDLEILNLQQNRFDGEIPQTFGSLLSLISLDLSRNNFSGTIPVSLQTLLYLKFLNLSFNSLQGEIPKGGIFVNLTATSFMMNKKLCGEARFLVPSCPTVPPGKTVTQVLEYGLAAFVLALILIIISLYVYKRRRNRNVTVPNQAVSSPMRPLKRISHQEIVQATEGFNETNLLGRGSFGSVFKGMLSDGTLVAVKVFNLQVQGSLRSFDTECEVLRSIRHRNLVSVITSCSNDLDFKALVLEYMPSGSLEKWLYADNLYLDMKQRLSIMIDVGWALEYLHHDHSTPIVHCDIKPSNILLDEDMVAHVSDFGIAKLFGEGESMKQTMTLATIGYMAPEYGSGGIVSTKADVYSYGILLMETFTRKKPADDMLVEDMSLKLYVEKSLPSKVNEVADEKLLSKEDEHLLAKTDCVSAILQLALCCSTESPEERIDIKDALLKLISIQKMLQQCEL